MKKGLILIILVLFSCKEVIKENKLNITQSNSGNVTESETHGDKAKLIDNNLIISDIKTIDSLFVGAEFYHLDAFKHYKFIEMEPYEELLTDNDNNMYHIMIYEKFETKYTLLVVLEENIGEGELSSIWKKTKKRVVDIIDYPKTNEICWHYSFKNENLIECCLFVIFDTNKVNIGLDQELKDTLRNEIIKNNALSVWNINYQTNKLEKVKNKNLLDNIECYY